MVNILDNLLTVKTGDFDLKFTADQDIYRPEGNDFNRILKDSIDNKDKNIYDYQNDDFSDKKAVVDREKENLKEAEMISEKNRKNSEDIKNRYADESKADEDKKISKTGDNGNKTDKLSDEEIKLAKQNFTEMRENLKALLSEKNDKSDDSEKIKHKISVLSDKDLINIKNTDSDGKSLEKLFAEIEKQIKLLSDAENNKEKTDIEIQNTLQALLNILNQIFQDKTEALSGDQTLQSVKSDKSSGGITGRESSSGITRQLLDKLAELKDMLDKKSDDNPRASSRDRNTGDSRLLRSIENSINQIQNGNQSASSTEVEKLSAKIDEVLKLLKDSEKNQRPNERTSDRSGSFNLSFLRNDSGASTMRADAVRNPSAAANVREQFSSFLDQARMVVRDGRNASFTMNLFPRELGAVRMSLGLENGVLSGRFIVENAEAKDALLSNLSLMKEKLEGEGVDVGAFEVDIENGKNRFSNDEDEIVNGGLSGLNEEAAVEYENMSVLRHEGSINLVI